MTVAEVREYDEEECNVTQEHPSKLSFSIEESVWLNKGQEVEEILGMSLEPEIVIEEKDHHVYIRGGLRLVGEYRPTGTDEASSDNSQTLQQQVSFRSAGDVTIASDGSGQIKHFFPIDVTIPLSRIQNLDDVYVEVDSFDYDLPERSCIQLTADISISGMTQHQETVESRVEKEIEKAAAAASQTQQTERVEEVDVVEEDTIVEEPTEQDVPSTAFAFEAKKQPEPEVTSRYEKVETQPNPPSPFQSFYKQAEQPSLSKVTPALESIGHQEEEEPTVTSYDSHKKLETEETSDYEVEREQPEAITEDERTDVDSTVEEVEELEDSLETEEVVEAVRETTPVQPETKINLAPQKEIVSEPTAAQNRPEEEASEDEATAKPPREENALYLTKMLSKGEERFSKWKMCIIQENESLDTIADRYEISTSQIVRMNRLQGEQVEEGQILYIPVSVES